MSVQASSSSKKRKHIYHTEGSEEQLSKKVKKERKEKSKKLDKKGKGRESNEEGEFKIISASVTLSIPPRFALFPMSGVYEMLDSLIMRYVPALQGVMLSHSNARFLSQTATIRNECPFAICDVGFDATVWSPQVGMKLKGKINLCSPDHISLLVHQTFNVAIPRHHIPTEKWEFEYGPAEIDPEFGPHAAHAEDKTEADVTAMELDGTAATAEDKQADSEGAGGSWIHKITGDKLGGKEGFLEFTVIGLTAANQMISLVGSIQPDPFAPEHIPQPAVAPQSKTSEVVDQDVEKREEPPEIAPLDEETSDDEDPFAALGRAREEAVDLDRSRKEKARAKEREEKKRRKKEKNEKQKVGEAVEESADVENKPAKKKRKAINPE